MVWGIYAVKIPLADGQSEAVLTGACLDQITEVFPTYPLHEILSGQDRSHMIYVILIMKIL